MNIDFVSDINVKNKKVINFRDIDGFMLKVLWWHFALTSLYALVVFFFNPSEFYPSPYSWRAIEWQGVFWTIVFGLFASSSMTLLRDKIQNHYVYRFLMTNALLVYSYLLVYITGGSIEFHFHFFIILGLLVLYYDWRLAWFAIVAVALHHGILNFIAPYWVYFYGRNDVAFSAHAVLVLIMAIFMTKIAETGRTSVEFIRHVNENLEKIVRKRTKQLEEAKATLESKVSARTKELQKSEEKMKQLLTVKSQFVNQISHDLRTPLLPISGLLPLLRENLKQGASKDNKEMLDRLQNNVDYLVSLVNDTLSLARLDAGKVQLNMQQHNVHDIAKHAIENVGNVGNNIHIVNHVQKTLPTVFADDIRIIEVLGNLISNASRFMTKKTKRIALRATATKNMVTVFVQDTGQGIEKQYLQKMFNEFEKLESAQSKHSSGLGLSICKRIVEKHKGKIWAESEGIGKGTTIAFTLPQYTGQDEKRKRYLS